MMCNGCQLYKKLKCETKYATKEKPTHEKRPVALKLCGNSLFTGQTISPDTELGVGDNWVFFLNEKFVELNTAKFEFLNQFLS